MSCRRIQSLFPWQLHEITEDRVAKPMRIINEFLDRILQDAMTQKVSNQNGDGGSIRESAMIEEDTLLSHLVTLSDGESVQRCWSSSSTILFSRHHLQIHRPLRMRSWISYSREGTRCVLGHAGNESSKFSLRQLSVSLTCAVYALSEHPEILNRLRSEVLEHVGRTRRPTYEDIHRMRYLRAFINGELNFFPAQRL